MSGRYYADDKGSSRSARDDSRAVAGREGRERRRSRSRSPRRRHSPGGSRGHSREDRPRDRDRHRGDDSRHRRHSSDSEEEVPAPPPPPRISKISIGFSKPAAPIKMSLSGPKPPAPALPKQTVASVFNDDDDDDDVEEMPPEARMRMRNVGRETPTSAGPNSFGKTKQGFCDSKKVFEKSLKAAMDGGSNASKSSVPKFPQTIYKINPNSH